MNRRASVLELAPAQSLTDRAYAEIEEMIITLRLAPGSAISESDLSAHLGIGRTPIREALQRLARGAEGSSRRSTSAASCGCWRSAER